MKFDGSPDATEKQARELATFKLNRPVGSAFEYTNTNYNLLGLIIEAASGEKYAHYVQTHIFDPLEMTHTYTSKQAAKQNGMSTGYISWFGIPVYPALRLLTSGVLKMWLYFLGDLSWLALICGGFAGIWAFLRTGLILRTLRKP